jgi:pimeloyl-ACP methyl ester carboxylesterase
MAEQRVVSVQGGKFEVNTFVQGSGPPLVYFHGYDGMLEWPAWLDFLAERYTVYAPQLPGVGASTGLEHVDDFHDLAFLELDYIDALGLQRPVLVGLDLGGSLAAEVAAHDSHNLSKLVLIAPTGLWLDEAPAPDFFAGGAAMIARNTFHDVDAAREKGLLPGLPTNEDEQKRSMLERQKALTTAGKFLWPIPDKGLKKRIHRVKVPTLLVWGTSDGLVPLAYAHAFKDMIAGSRLAILEEAGHLPMLEQPEEFRRTVLDFLAG